MFSTIFVDFGEYYFKDNYPGRSLVAEYTKGFCDTSKHLEVMRLFSKTKRDDWYTEKDENGKYSYIYVTYKTLAEVKMLNEMAHNDEEKTPFFKEIL